MPRWAAPLAGAVVASPYTRRNHVKAGLFDRSRGVARLGELDLLDQPVNRVALAWSGDGKRLASSASLERTILVWDAATGAKLLTLPGHPQQVRSLAWGRDGKSRVTLVQALIA